MGISQPVRPAARQRCFKFCQHVEASPCGFGRFVLEGVPGTHPAKTAAQGFYGVQGAGAVMLREIGASCLCHKGRIVFLLCSVNRLRPTCSQISAPGGGFPHAFPEPAIAGARPWQASGRAKAVEGAARALGRGGV